MRATTASSATTTSGGCLRRTTRTAAPIPRIDTSATAPVFRAGPPGSLISPNLAGRLAADFALCYQLDRVTEPKQAATCLKDAEDIYALANTHPGQPADRHSLRLLPGEGVARRPRMGRDGALRRPVGGSRCRQACRTRTRCTTCARRRTGRTRTSPGRTTQPTRSISTTSPAWRTSSSTTRSSTQETRPASR